MPTDKTEGRYFQVTGADTRAVSSQLSRGIVTIGEAKRKHFAERED